MKIASYDEPIKKIRVSVNLLDYLSLRYRNPDGIKELRKLPGTRYSLNQYGCPESRKINAPPIRAYTSRLLNLNQALAIALMPDSRDGLSQEVRNFLVLNKDPRLPEQVETESTEKEKINKRLEEKARALKDEKKPTFDFSELGSEMDMSPTAVELRNLLGQKRRDTNEFYITRRFLFPLAMLGIQCADPAYRTAILSADNFGVKHTDPEIRLASISILDETVKSIWLKFQMAKKSGILPVFKQGETGSFFALVSFQDLEDDLASLQTINNAVSQNDYGINDSDSDVRDLAELTSLHSSKAQKVIREYFKEQGYSS
jgi:hypothetical protein